MVGTYKLADVVVEVNSRYERVQHMLEDYACVESAQLRVCTTHEDIEHEYELISRRCISKPLFIQGYYEELAVLRKIAERLPQYGGFLFHGSALMVDGLSYLFTAPSGTGKSTHASIWRALLGPKVTMINDDKPFIRMGSGVPYVYGSPWDGKHHLSSNTCAPIAGICLLEQADYNWIYSIQPYAVMPSLIRQTYRPHEPAALSRTLDLLDEVTQQAGLYRMGCKVNMQAARMSYDHMRKGCVRS